MIENSCYDDGITNNLALSIANQVASCACKHCRRIYEIVVEEEQYLLDTNKEDEDEPMYYN
jgi:hypothetical protein